MSQRRVIGYLPSRYEYVDWWRISHSTRYFLWYLGVHHRSGSLLVRFLVPACHEHVAMDLQILGGGVGGNKETR